MPQAPRAQDGSPHEAALRLRVPDRDSPPLRSADMITGRWLPPAGVPSPSAELRAAARPEARADPGGASGGRRRGDRTPPAASSRAGRRAAPLPSVMILSVAARSTWLLSGWPANSDRSTGGPATTCTVLRGSSLGTNLPYGRIRCAPQCAIGTTGMLRFQRQPCHAGLRHHGPLLGIPGDGGLRIEDHAGVVLRGQLGRLLQHQGSVGLTAVDRQLAEPADDRADDRNRRTATTWPGTPGSGERCRRTARRRRCPCTTGGWRPGSWARRRGCAPGRCQSSRIIIRMPGRRMILEKFRQALE